MSAKKAAKDGVININSDHLLVSSLKKYYLTTSKIKETDSEATIYVSSSFLAEKVLQDKKEIENALEKPLKIVTEAATSIPEQPRFEALKGSITSKVDPRTYMYLPFLRGSSNASAFDFCQGLISGVRSGIIFIYGPSGVGKSHLIYQTAFDAKEKGAHVYINETTVFLDELTLGKEGKTNTQVLQAWEKYDTIILDNFQVILKGNTMYAFDHAIFPIFDSFLIHKKNIFLASDTPLSKFQKLPPRTISRISYPVEIHLPDKDLKKRVLEQHCIRLEVNIPDDIKELIISKSSTIRSLVAAINAFTLFSTDAADLRNALLEKLDLLNPTFVGSGYEGVDRILATHFKIENAVTKGKNTPRNVGQYRACMYYLWHDRIDVKELRERLNVISRLHARTLATGKKNYEALHQSVQEKIKQLMAE